MDYEKAYKEALKRAKFKIKNNKDHVLYEDDIIEMFSELKENEDERIRKEILEYFQQFENEELRGVNISDWIAWLEKQGVQEESQVYETEDGNIITYSETDGYKVVEPKFKVGDWVVNNKTKDVFFIKNTNSGYCTLEDIKGNIISPCLPQCESESHLWTIEDAKPGDVLAWDDSKCIALFKNIYDKDSFNSYGFVGHCTGTFESRLSYHDIECTHPATKEQRNLLFQKMKEAGYEWDAEKKEPKKIEPKPAIEMKTPEESLGIDSDTYNKIVDECVFGEQKPAWSEEDEENFNQLHKLIVEKAHRDYEIDTDDETLWGKYAILDNWLKSLKERMKGE